MQAQAVACQLGQAGGMRRAAWGPALVWAVGLAAVTTVGLGLLTWGLVVMHALVYGVDGVIGQGVVEAVDVGRTAWRSGSGRG